MTDVELLEILYDALRANIGVCVETNDPERLRQKLYAVRRGSSDFEPLSFIISPINGIDLWVLKRNIADAPE